GIIDRDFDLDVVEICSRKALDQVELVRVRCSLPLHPKSFVEADRVDHQSVSLPVTNRVSVVAGKQIFRMRPAIHINNSEGLRAGDVKDIDGLEFGAIDKLDSTRCDELTWSSGRFAACMRLKQVGFAVFIESPRPRLERNFTFLGFPGEGRSGESSAALPVRDRGVGFRFSQYRTAIGLPEPLFSWRC